MLTTQMFVEPMPFKLLVIRWLLLAISMQTVFSRPVQESSNTHRQARSTLLNDNELDYLTKFGYLEALNATPNNLMSVNQQQNALRTLQMFGNIPITGKIDTATIELMNKQRCGVSDISHPADQRRTKRNTQDVRKWDHVNLTWSLRKGLANVDIQWVKSDFYRAFQMWSKHSKLTFREVDSRAHADILVSFENGDHGDGNAFKADGNTLAHAFSPGSGLGGDVHFNEGLKWLVAHQKTKDGNSLLYAAAHEFGHSLGLSHSNQTSSLMYPWIQDVGSDFELPKSEQISIQNLYGANNDKRISQRPNILTTVSTITTIARPDVRSDTRTTISLRQPDVTVVVDEIPNFCNTAFDAVSIIREETYFFKGKYTWRIGSKGLYARYPALISQMWIALPNDLNQIDAVYERQDNKIVFFIGRFYYVFHGTTLSPGYPKPLTALGLPEKLDHVDAAMVWGHDSKTYIFSGTMFWKLRDDMDWVELDYPQDMSTWRGVGYNIDAAFKGHNGATYFFKNRGFWKFDDLRMRVEQVEPSSIGEFWLNCTSMGGGDSGNNNKNHQGSSAADRTPSPILVTVVLLATIFRWAQ